MRVDRVVCHESGRRRVRAATDAIGSIGSSLKPPPRRRIPTRVTDAADQDSASGALGHTGDGVRVQRHLLGHALVRVALDVTQAIDDE